MAIQASQIVTSYIPRMSPNETVRDDENSEPDGKPGMKPRQESIALMKYMVHKCSKVWTAGSESFCMSAHSQLFSTS